MSLIKCDRKGCNRDAVYTGHVYGREKGTSENTFFPVNACGIHAKSNGFFVNEKVGEHHDGTGSNRTIEQL